MAVQKQAGTTEAPAQLLCDRELARQLKSEAALKGQSIKECLEGLIRSYLEGLKHGRAWLKAQKARGAK